MINNIDNLFQQLLNALQMSEKRHRAVRDDASDNSDWNTYDAEGELISNIIRWRRSLEPLRIEIVESGAVDEVDIPISSMTMPSSEDSHEEANEVLAATPSENEEEIKVGKYIQTKLRELSESGFVFEPEQLRQMCDLDWSRKIFTYDRFLPFAKIVDIRQDISEQTKDENGYNRYWNRVFRFGDTPLLIMSQWYTKDKESFDKWYESLPHTQTTLECDAFVFRKAVDWSTLNYGITVPVAHWELFFNAIGQTIAIGESCNISVHIGGSEEDTLKASVIHSVTGTTSALQIRYTQASEVAEELRRIFHCTFDYCTRERSLHTENTRIFIPSSQEEYIDVYATGVPRALKFVCVPSEISIDAQQTPVRAKSLLIHAKQRNNGNNIVEVSSSFVSILSFPDNNTVISAKYDAETEQVLFRAEVLGVPFPEKALGVSFLKEIALLESKNRIHRVAVPEDVNVSKQMMFMAWIDSDDSSNQVEIHELSPSDTEQGIVKIKPVKMILLGKEYPVRAWNEMYIKICEVMLLHSPYCMAAMDKDTDFNTEHRTYFSFIQSDIKVNGKRLSNGLWVETNMNRQETESKGRRLLEKCGFSSDDLQVETMEVI